MKKNDDLFDLIQSMTKTEKGYFKKFTSRFSSSSSENNYLKLFDALEKQKVYDEAAILKKFRKEKFAKNLAVSKNYLYHSILKSLRVYHSGSNQYAQLNEMTDNIRFLMSKRLNLQALRMLKKAKKLAYEMDNFPALMYLLQEERTLIITHQITNPVKAIPGILEEELKVVSLQENLVQYMKRFYMLFMESKRDFILREKEHIKMLDSMMDDAMLKDESLALSRTALIRLNSTWYFYHSVKAETEQAFHFARKVVDAYGEPSSIPSFVLNSYLGALNNYCNSCYYGNKYPEFLEALDKLKNFPSQQGNFPTRVFERAARFELLYSIKMGEFRKGLEKVPDVEKGIEKHYKLMASEARMVMYSNIGHIYFATKHYEKSIEWFNKLIDEAQEEFRVDQQTLARILILMSYYESGMDSLLESALRSAYRFMYNRKKLHHFEAVVLKYLKKLHYSIDHHHQIELFTTLRKELLEVLKNREEASIMEYFDFISWLTSKIEGREFGEVVREQVG